ncbi:phosphotransferase [Nocardioides sp.]|uniref:phosphotransferase n=1 Tax=Nocardioides sp. TaxID=35761 RepID=UPI00378517BB
MGGRDALGAADVPDRTLLAMVADQVGGPVERIDSLVVEPVAYDVPSMTTAGRWWVRGHAGTGSFAFFVKQVQAWTRSPVFAMVPEEFREAAAASYPWRTEREVYRSDLRDRLPAGLRMPRAYGVHDVDDESYALWLEVVATAGRAWSLDRFARAAHLLGRLSSSPEVAEVADVGGFAMSAETYRATRVTMQLEPILRSDIWEHPALSVFDPTLRERLLAALDVLPELAAEVGALPRLAAHGDACPGNLLVTDDDPDGFTLIDFGQFTPLPVGFDLTQLLVGETMIGKLPASALGTIEDVVVPAYAAGCGHDEDTVRRAHAILLFAFTGLSAVPFDLLETTPPPQLAPVAAERAAVTRFSLDLLDATSRGRST